MADWSKITGGGDVEDRRGFAPVALGGTGIVGVAIVLLLNFLGGSSPDLGSILTQLQSTQVQQQNVNPEEFAGADDYEVFASKVLGSNNEVWRGVFERSNQTYIEPKLVLFRGATQSACGGATSDIGPHYCPADQTIYIDETFFDELSKLGASGGDVAEAYVIAHEVGHHVQHQLGTMEKIESRRDNQASINLELQADCYAGVWANAVSKAGVIAPGEINEAIDAAAAVGDDRIQQKAQGRVNPETWTHGSSAQRVGWFNEGFESGNPGSCNTFQ